MYRIPQKLDIIFFFVYNLTKIPKKMVEIVKFRYLDKKCRERYVLACQTNKGSDVFLEKKKEREKCLQSTVL